MAKDKRKKWRDVLPLGVLPLDLGGDKPGENVTDHISFLAFEVGGQTFAIGVEHTEGVVDCPRVTPLPSPPDGVIGVTSIRGKMTVVMDLSFTATQKEEKRRLVLLKGEGQVGLLADHVDGVVAIKSDEVRSPRPRKSDEGEPKSWLTDKCIESRGREATVIDGERLAGA